MTDDIPTRVSALEERADELQEQLTPLSKLPDRIDVIEANVETGIASLNKTVGGLHTKVVKLSDDLTTLTTKVEEQAVAVKEAVSTGQMQIAFPRITARNSIGSNEFLRGGSASATVDIALRELLGRTPPADSRGVAGLLTRSFVPVDTHGVREWKWQRSYGGGDTGFGSGGISAAQRILIDRISPLQEKAAAIIDDVEPINPKADPELVGALRAKAASEFDTLMDSLTDRNEIIQVQAQELFMSLGIRFNGVVPALTINPGSKPLSCFGRELGMVTAEVHTEQDEAQFTAFELLQATLFDIARAYTDFANNDQKYLSSKIFRLSRRLLTALEDAVSVEDVMDQLLLGPQQREVTDLAPTCGKRLPLAGLLRWIKRFCESDGPELLRESGNQAKDEVVRQLEFLHNFCKAQIPALKTPPAFLHPAVQNAWKQLTASLEKAKNEAGKL